MKINMGVVVFLRDALKETASCRPYDFAIGGVQDPYCLRWWVIPRNKFFNIYLHKFVRDDDDRALHDHPWLNCSIPLENGYWEEQFKWPWRKGWALPLTKRIFRSPGTITVRRGSMPHRVVLNRDMNGDPIPCWSLFITGPALRRWGFICPAGRWVHWKDFTSFRETGNSGMVGRGCE